MLRSQSYETMVPSSVDAEASNVQVSAGQLHVKLATGALLTGGGGGGGVTPKDAKSRRFGEPVPASVTLPVLAAAMRAAATAEGVAVGWPWR